MPSNEEHEYLRGILLGLPGVRLGIRFGREAFFVGKRFFCHFHWGGTLLLETFVWDNVNQVVRGIPGVIPHPQYGAYGWVRLRISSRADLAKARKLIEASYRYAISTKRISLPKTMSVRKTVKGAGKNFPEVRFRMKPSSKRLQIVMEIRHLNDPAEADEILRKAASYLRKH